MCCRVASVWWSCCHGIGGASRSCCTRCCHSVATKACDAHWCSASGWSRQAPAWRRGTKNQLFVGPGACWAGGKDVNCGWPCAGGCARVGVECASASLWCVRGGGSCSAAQSWKETASRPCVHSHPRSVQGRSTTSVRRPWWGHLGCGGACCRRAWSITNLRMHPRS